MRLHVDAALDKWEEMIQLRPGVINNNAEYIYMNGQCPSMAYAIAKAIGGSVYGYKFGSGNYSNCNGLEDARNFEGLDDWNYFGHFAASDGEWLYDINGKHDPLDITSRHGLVKISHSMFRLWNRWDNGFITQSWKLATSFMPAYERKYFG